MRKRSTMDTTSKPDENDLNIIDGEASDKDPEVIEGMRRLARLRAAESDIPEIGGRLV